MFANRRPRVRELFRESAAPSAGQGPDFDPDGPYSCAAEEALDEFFSSSSHPGSFRERYVGMTGDKRITGRLQDCNPNVMREALDTSSWPNVLGNAVARNMVREYSSGTRSAHWRVWRKLVRIGRLTDFRTQFRVRIGGYGDLPKVMQAAPYLALQSPPEESASYAAEKRGGTESITLEMIKNDDVNSIQRIPRRLADAAQRTIAHFVLDFLRTNPVIYDGVALFHASHGNLGNAALSAAGLAAGRVAMQKQTELGSGDRLGVEPKFLAVPFDLEETGVNQFVRGTNNDKTFVQDLPIEVLPIWYWTDTDDWCLIADPDILPSIELGFLDGVEEPQVFIQDEPSVGSMFAQDQLTFKIRHIYGGAVVDYRGLYKSIVP
jgi:hypothetical protein